MRDPLDAFLRDLGSLFRVCRMYPVGNQQVARAAQKAAESLSAVGRPVRILRLGDDVVVEDRAVEDPPAALAALLGRLVETGREALQVDADATPEDLARWVEGLVRDGLSGAEGGRIRAGTLDLEGAKGTSARLTDAAAGYMTLMPGVQEALSDLAQERSGGLLRAREIVRSIVGQMATGEDLLSPLRGLRAHDDYTFTHALNVSVVTAALARLLGAAPGLVDVISLAALCHDVGKERVPPEILNKDGVLDEREREIMNRHPVEGARILLGLGEAVHPLLPVVAYQHHRGADGGGYPERPDVGRSHPVSLLVAVADVYDALRTVRSYQAPRSAAGAFTIMLREGRRGHVHLPYLGTMARLLGLLGPGARVVLTDGRPGRVLEEGHGDPLQPRVEVEGGAIVDLGGVPELALASVEDPPAA